MRLNGRVARLEAAQRARQIGEPCRWHGPLVVYPATLPRNELGRVNTPPCETPATCTGPRSAQIYLPERRTV
jgi:hypothetical protein